MTFKLRFVQRFKQSNRNDFLDLEKKFIMLERLTSDFPKAKRYIPLMGKEATNTLIWEAEFTSLAEAISALNIIESNPQHDTFFNEQSQFMLDAYTEIYQLFDIP